MKALKERIEDLNLIPLVREQIQEALEAEGLIEESQLDAILPALKSALQIAKKADGTFRVDLVANGNVLKHDNDTNWDVGDFVRDFVFTDDLPKGCKGVIPFEESFSLSPEDIDAVSNGTKIIGPRKRKAKPKGMISPFDQRAMTQNIDKIASGEVEVDMS